MSDIKIPATAVVDFSYPAGTVLGKMRYKLIDSRGTALTFQDIDVPPSGVLPEVDFLGQPVGHYTLSIQRMSAASSAVGPEYTQAITIDPPPLVVGSAPSGATVVIV